MNLAEFNNLDFSQFEGYLWFSNAESPEFELKKLEPNTIPFVVEGFLYDSQNKKSISVKNFNGEYVITEFEIKNLDNIRFAKETQYPAYKLEGIKYVKRCKMQEKTTCENGFAVWQNVADVFVGFEKNKKS